MSVTPDERDRLARVEERVANLADDFDTMNDKLDRLVAAANMGKGAWWLILRIGGLLVVLGAAVSAVVQIRNGWH